MGKKSSPPPNYLPLAQASEQSARLMAGLGQQQLDFAERQYNELAPYLRSISETQRLAQLQQMEQAGDYYDYQQQTYRPVEQRIVAAAQQFNTPAYSDQLAAQAAANSGLAFSQTRAANERAAASMGVNPNSGRFAGLQSAAGLVGAANKAAAMTDARVRAEQLGYARSLDVAGLGRNLPGASAAAYAGATQSGTAAGQSAQSAGQNYMGNMAIGSGTIGSGQDMRIRGLSSVLNAQTQAYINSNDSVFGDVGGILGGVAGLSQAGLFSDRRLKENIRPVGFDEGTQLTLYEFNYKGRPGTRYVGVMADEVEVLHPEAVVEQDGYLAVNYAQLGLKLTEVA